MHSLMRRFGFIQIPEITLAFGLTISSELEETGVYRKISDRRHGSLSTTRCLQMHTR